MADVRLIGALQDSAVWTSPESLWETLRSFPNTDDNAKLIAEYIRTNSYWKSIGINEVADNIDSKFKFGSRGDQFQRIVIPMINWIFGAPLNTVRDKNFTGDKVAQKLMDPQILYNTRELNRRHAAAPAAAPAGTSSLSTNAVVRQSQPIASAPPHPPLSSLPPDDNAELRAHFQTVQQQLARFEAQHAEAMNRESQYQQEKAQMEEQIAQLQSSLHQSRLSQDAIQLSADSSAAEKLAEISTQKNAQLDRKNETIKSMENQATELKITQTALQQQVSSLQQLNQKLEQSSREDRESLEKTKQEFELFKAQWMASLPQSVLIPTAQIRKLTPVDESLRAPFNGALFLANQAIAPAQTQYASMAWVALLSV
jgi:hypothetical protein